MPKLSANVFMVKYPHRIGGTMVLAFSSGGHISRREAIKAFKPRFVKGMTWKKAYARGARVVSVHIREI